LNYAELFGDEARTTNNKVWLVKRIAWRLQALVEGDLSERARQRASELGNDADVRLSPPSSARAAPIVACVATPTGVDQRQPRVGTVLTRVYKGRALEVVVLPDGFRFDGAVYSSLSAVAKAITGSHTSGRLFFRLTEKGGRK
jgi:hypothetical protein